MADSNPTVSFFLFLYLIALVEFIYLSYRNAFAARPLTL